MSDQFTNVACIAAHKTQLEKIEDMILRGIRNQEQIGAAFGITKVAVGKIVKEIYKGWKDSSIKDSGLKRELRIRQLEHVMHIARTEFERSRKDAQEYSIVERTCARCRGQGKTEEMPDEWTTCVECLGRGKIVVETTKTRGQAGDPAYLKVIQSCIVECTRIEGLYPERMSTGRVLATSSVVGGELQEKVEEIYFEGPADFIINAKTVLDEFVRHKKKGAIKKIREESIDTTVSESDRNPGKSRE